jgi:hypothetical protein
MPAPQFPQAEPLELEELELVLVLPVLDTPEVLVLVLPVLDTPEVLVLVLPVLDTPEVLVLPVLDTPELLDEVAPPAPPLPPVPVVDELWAPPFPPAPAPPLEKREFPTLPQPANSPTPAMAMTK